MDKSDGQLTSNGARDHFSNSFCCPVNSSNTKLLQSFSLSIISTHKKIKNKIKKNLRNRVWSERTSTARVQRHPAMRAHTRAMLRCPQPRAHGVA